jgi:hypothetical protein
MPTDPVMDQVARLTEELEELRERLDALEAQNDVWRIRFGHKRKEAP